MVENLPANAGDARDMGLIPGLERSPGVGNGIPLQYSCLPGGLTVHRVTERWKRPSNRAHMYHV